MLAHIIDPEVFAGFGGREVEELLIVCRELEVSEARRGRGDAYGSQVEVVPLDAAVVRLGRLCLLRLRGVGLGLLLSFLEEGEVFVIHTVLLVGGTVEEDSHDVVEGAPRSVVAHPVLVGGVEEDVAIVRPAWIVVEVATVGQVVDGLIACSTHDTNVGVRTTSARDVGEGNPLTIR